jgi:histidyl-tRNA synthetase
LILKQYGLSPEYTKTPADVFITVFSDELLLESIKIGQELRSAGIKTASQLKQSKLGSQFKFADRIGAKLAIVYGPDEHESKSIKIKNLQSGEQFTIERNQMIKKVVDLLE